MGPMGWSGIVFMTPGLAAFIFGIVAENTLPEPNKSSAAGLAVCDYGSDRSIAHGILSIILLFISTAFALTALFYPYKGKSVPQSALWKSTLFLVFFTLSVALFCVAEGLLLWATIKESTYHKLHNKQSAVTVSCPTAKPGVFGGAAFLALDTSLFWLICLILVGNARNDYFAEDEAPEKNDAFIIKANGYSTAPLIA